MNWFFLKKKKKKKAATPEGSYQWTFWPPTVNMFGGFHGISAKCLKLCFMVKAFILSFVCVL
jgi:hypothetical protein